MISAVQRGWGSLIDFLLPRLCCGCGDRVMAPELLVCPDCVKAIPPLIQPVCGRCGCPDARVKDADTCTNCPTGVIWFSRARAATGFAGTAQTAVFRLKYQGRTEYADFLGDAMVKEFLVDRDPGNVGLILPVPLHSTRQRSRGFNQSALLGRHIASHLQVPFDPKVLKRTRPTITQTRLKKKQRRQNVLGAFQCIKPGLVCGKHILLVDDVYTTGSTLNECARVLIDAGAASVECLAYARAVMA